MPPLLCNLLGHRRSGRDARRIDGRWISYCRWCGSLMVRAGPQSWTVVRFADGVPMQPEYEHNE
jgi:hypothetical protein